MSPDCFVTYLPDRSPWVVDSRQASCPSCQGTYHSPVCADVETTLAVTPYLGSNTERSRVRTVLPIDPTRFTLVVPIADFGLKPFVTPAHKGRIGIHSDV
jgi:hypothetical protein